MGQGISAIHPTVAASRHIPKAEPANGGAVARTIGAVPDREAEISGVCVCLASPGFCYPPGSDGRWLVNRESLANDGRLGFFISLLGLPCVLVAGHFHLKELNIRKCFAYDAHQSTFLPLINSCA